MLTLKKKTVTIEGTKVELRAMSAGCYAEFMDAKADGANDLTIAAIIAKHCCNLFEGWSTERVLDETSATGLSELMVEVLAMGEDEKKTSAKVATVGSSAA